MHDIAFLAPGGAGYEFAAVGHYHLDGVVVRMDIGLHSVGSCGAHAKQLAGMGWIWRGLYRRESAPASGANLTALAAPGHKSPGRRSGKALGCIGFGRPAASKSGTRDDG